MPPSTLHITGIALVLSLPAILCGQDIPDVSEAAQQLHERSLVIDGHNDLAWEVRLQANSSWDDADIAQSQPRFHTDIPRLRAGNIGAQFWSVYVPADTRFRGQSAQQTLEQINLVHQMIDRYPETFELADSADDILRIRKHGKIACLLGMEGGHSIENSISMLAKYRELGVKYMTLTHGDTLEWADSSTDSSQHDGLTDFGEDVIREMNRLGMIVDISHVSDATVEDALRVSQAPVIASHSSARAISNHPRNLPDHLLKSIADHDGLVMINFYSGFVVPESAIVMTEWIDVRRNLKQQFPDSSDYKRESAKWWKEHPLDSGSVKHVLDHVDHAIQIAGADHVGLGGDFDGVDRLPEGLEDVSTYPRLTQGLLDRGYSADEIQNVLGRNMLRILRAVDETATTMAKEQSLVPIPD